MDLPRLQEMHDYQIVNPPLHLMVRSYLGAGKKRRAVKKMTDKDFAEMVKVADGMTPSQDLAVYRGGRLPKIGDPLWQTTPLT